MIAQSPQFSDSYQTPIVVDQCESIPVFELTPTHWQEWMSWRGANPALRSPFFDPEFTRLAARVRPETDVLVFTAGGVRVGYLPFHRVGKEWGIPIGGRLNDYHGIVADRPILLDMRRALSASGLSRWEFHAWYWPQPPVHRCGYARQLFASRCDIDDMATYLANLRRDSSTIARHPQKSRKLLREHGPIRFVVDESNPRILEWLILKKREKYARTKCTDYFACAWSRELLARILATRLPSFSGLLSVLYAGEQPIAGHFGMVAGTTLHYWFPVYDPDYAKYSPGTELFLRVVEAAATMGIRTIDFGYGSEPYKSRLLTETDHVWTGAFDSHVLRRCWYDTWEGLVTRIKQGRFHEVVKRACRAVFPDLGKPVMR